MKAFTCEVCGKIFTNRDSLIGHQGQHSEDGSTLHECGDCGKVLRSRRSLDYHQRSQHSGRRSFLCSLCPQGFMSEKLLQAHQCKHTGDKPFKWVRKCEYNSITNCNRQYWRKKHDFFINNTVESRLSNINRCYVG